MAANLLGHANDTIAAPLNHFGTVGSRSTGGRGGPDPTQGEGWTFAGLVLAFRFLRSLMSLLIGLAGSVLLGVTGRELLMNAFFC